MRVTFPVRVFILSLPGLLAGGTFAFARIAGFAERKLIWDSPQLRVCFASDPSQLAGVVVKSKKLKLTKFTREQQAMIREDFEASFQTSRNATEFTGWDDCSARAPEGLQPQLVILRSKNSQERGTLASVGTIGDPGRSPDLRASINSIRVNQELFSWAGSMQSSVDRFAKSVGTASEKVSRTLLSMILIHEAGHVLALRHEQARSDALEKSRRINVGPEIGLEIVMEQSWEKMRKIDAEYYGDSSFVPPEEIGEFDALSVMHYGRRHLYLFAVRAKLFCRKLEASDDESLARYPIFAKTHAALAGSGGAPTSIRPLLEARLCGGRKYELLIPSPGAGLLSPGDDETLRSLYLGVSPEGNSRSEAAELEEYLAPLAANPDFLKLWKLN